MTAAIAAIHIARKQLGLGDDDYRAILERLTGKRSASALSFDERGLVLQEFRRLGFKRRLKAPETGREAPPRRQLDGPFAGKLQALWISGWNLGVVAKRDDEALLSFVERQTGISHTRFLRDAGDAAKAIEALKAWLAREAGVDWTIGKRRPAVFNDPQFQIATAQWRRLIALGAVVAGTDQNTAFAARMAPETGKDRLGEMRRDDWIALHRALGRSIRSALRRQSRRAA